MSATVKYIDPTAVELEITISAPEFAQAEERAFRRLAQSARIPGFRPGKAPRSVFEAQYGHHTVHERALEQVVPEAYSQAIREHNLTPIDHPKLEVLPQEGGTEGDVHVRATVTVRPNITLGTYKGIELTGKSFEVTDETVENALEELRKGAAVLVPADRSVAFGDTATLDYEGRIDGVAFEGGAATDQPTEILEDRFIPGFAQGIVGMSAGESKEIEAEFPADYLKAELAGKHAVFTLTVREVKSRELPELTDDFSARYRPDGTLTDLRADLRTRLVESARLQNRRDLSVTLIEKLLAMHDFPVPPLLLERENEALQQEAKNDAARVGASWEEYLRAAGLEEERFLEERSVEAQRRVASSLLLSEIAKVEKIQASAEEVDAEVAALCRQYGQTKERMLELLRPTFSTLIEGIVRKKTIEFLLDSAVIVRSDEASSTQTAQPADSVETSQAGL
ncbi:MAG TPA: trigger factor [Candidatus Baltobacteraceae bacterium]|nr:trigger factor [Candidatus Baltobacteraceae bacterium]